jgi:XapX domain-containing protein
MKAWFLSLGVGFLVGVIYAVLGVRSPAPPVIALIGLLGMVAGEQSVPLAQRLLHDRSDVSSAHTGVGHEARLPPHAKAPPQPTDVDAR